MPASTPTADIVNTWFSERLASGPLARDTEAYNQAVGALPDLIARIDGAALPVETDVVPQPDAPASAKAATPAPTPSSSPSSTQ